MKYQLSKTLDVLFAIEFVLIIAIILLSLIGNKKIPTGYAVKENSSTENSDFKLMTKAVCEEKYDHILCHDELFAKCNGEEKIINGSDFAECGNIKIKLSEIANGSVKLEKEWADPRK